MNVKRFLGKCAGAFDFIQFRAKLSYAQAGEDLIARYFFDALGVAKPTYLEIGTNQPVTSNNTYLLYRQGSRGVCVEPDASLIPIIQKARPEDIVLNVGVGAESATALPFFQFPGVQNAWNTFSAEEAKLREQASGLTATEKLVPVLTLNSIIADHLQSTPDFLSVDVEGLDLPILQSLNFDLYAPKLICVETITFSLDNREEKTTDVHEFMRSKGYSVYADTHINTLFFRQPL